MEKMGLGMEIGSRRMSQGDSAKLKFGMLEVEDKTNLETGCTQVVEHASHFVIGDPINGFGIDDDFAINDEIWNVFPDFNLAVMKWKPALLSKWNSLKPEFNRERLFVRFFMKPMTQRIMNGKRATNNKLGLFDMNPISSICVHPVYLWLESFRPRAARRVVGDVH